MNHVTSIGLDVHARSITGAAFNPSTGEIITRKFSACPAEVAQWILSFESPKAVYESGVTGFYLVRELRALGVDCIVGAVSKMHKPASDKRKKYDAADATFLARMLCANNIVEVMVPDEECEAMRDLTRALEDVREDLARAKQRLTKFLLRHGYVFNETNEKGQRKSSWTKAHWAWIRSIELAELADRETLDFYISEIKHFESHKKQLEKFVEAHAKKERWNERVEALRLIKGIEIITAFSLVVEADTFSRFKSASAFASWTGLTPSEHSSGERAFQGSITKAGNAHVRKMLVESSWHFTQAQPTRKKSEVVPLRIENHAHKGNMRLIEKRQELHERGKKSVVANCATARELAGWIWAIGCMCEGTL